MAAAFAAVNFYAATNLRASCDLRCQIFTIELQLRKSCESCDPATFLFVFLRLKI